jgi:hypothetical protein
MKNVKEEFDVVVLGGGLAGFAAAVAAARHGARTALVQDRPVLGGNSSSEVRVTPHGAGRHHPYAAETGLMAEALAAERQRCHVEPMNNAWTNSQWDLALYDVCLRTPGLRLFLNTTLIDVLLEDGTRGSTLDPENRAVCSAKGYFERPALNPCRRIAAVECRAANAEVQLTLTGKHFIDCTGDAVCAHLAGASWRWGSEAAGEFGEIHAPAVANSHTMGSSIQFYCHDAGRPVPFVPPPWAQKIDDPDFFWGKGGRMPYEPRGGFWWIEIGVPYNTVHDNETIRAELTAWTLGIWDWMKNKDVWMKDKCANYVLDWIGQVPGKRESRRVMGRHFIHENELTIGHVFPDEIGHGGWYLDLHTPGGLLAENSEPMAAEGYAAHSIERAKGHVGPYGIPLRCLLSRDLDNLAMAGRNISATKAALGSLRVMQTCGVMGQAIGTAAALATRAAMELGALNDQIVGQVQDLLLRDGVFLPHIGRPVRGDLVPSAALTATSQATFATTGCARPPANKTEPSPLKQTFDLAQSIPVAGPRLEKISLCLSLDWPGAVRVPVTLRQVDSIWDYDRSAGAVLAEAVLTVRPGVAQWIEWPLALDLPRAPCECGYVRLELRMNHPGRLTWEPAPCPVPGCVAYYLMPGGAPGSRGERYRRHSETPGTTFALAVEPPQNVFPVDHIARPHNRPFRDTGMWRSDPAEALPQTVEARWSAPQTIRQIELHFPGNLLTELSTRPPLYADPDIARDYHIEALMGDAWRRVAEAAGNFQHHRLHTLPEPVVASALRLVITATNGSPSASLANLRVFTAPGDYPDPWTSP